MVMRNRLLVPVLASTLAVGALLSGVSHADQRTEEIFNEDRPSGGAMVLDALVARPVLAVGTIVGAGLYVVTVPFSLLGGNAGQSFDTLVVAPAESLLVRCLGCSPVQHERMSEERRAERGIR